MRAIHLFIFREFVYYSFYITSLSIFYRRKMTEELTKPKGQMLRPLPPNVTVVAFVT